MIQGPPDPVDPATLDLALKQIRDIARGNGVDPETITIDNFEGLIVDYTAQAQIVVQPKVVEKSVPGREKGEVCSSSVDFQTKIRTTIEKITINRDILDFIARFMEKRPDKGFMAPELAIPFDHLKRSFVFHAACPQCTGGKTNCLTCHGAGASICPKCRGQKRQVCPGCRGSRVTRASDGTQQQCRQCGGRGDVSCPGCRASGQVKCRACAGIGKTSCRNCNATGFISHIAAITFEGSSVFTYDMSGMPAELVKIINRAGPAMVVSNHADVKLLKEKMTEGTPVVPYQVRLPWGAIRFKMDGDTIDAMLFGKRPRLLSLPPFLEKVIAPATEQLALVAKGQGNLDEAINTRLIADALVAASTLTRKKALMTMRKRWPQGISTPVLDSITMQAVEAYAHISKMPRLIGLGAGLVVAACIDGVYMIGSVRTIILLQSGLPPVAMIAMDAALIALTGLIAGMTARLNARRSLQHLFKKLMPPEALKKIIPHAGSIGAYAYLAAAIIFAGIAVTGYFTGHGILPGYQF